MLAELVERLSEVSFENKNRTSISQHGKLNMIFRNITSIVRL